MKDAFRLGATFVIWLALTIILTSATTAVSGSATVLLILAGLGSTVAIWLAGNVGVGAKGVMSSVEKSKRDSRDRVTRLVQDMDDDQIAQLGDLLSQNDDSAGYNQRLGR